MLTFNPRYFLFATILFITEILIALFVHDRIIRPYVGDYLVVILIYCAVRTFFQAPVLKVAIGVLLFSYLVEVLQYFKIVDRLGLAENVIAKTVIGYGFEWLDMLAYTLGVMSVVIIERGISKRTKIVLSVCCVVGVILFLVVNIRRGLKEINDAFSCQTEWKYLKLRDTVSGVVVFDSKASVNCGIFSSASTTLIRTDHGDIIRILQMCNTDIKLKLGARVKFAPEGVPSFRVDDIPYDPKACEIKEAYFGRAQE